MIELLVASLMNCRDAEDLINNVNASRVEYKQEVIEVIKSNSEPQCFTGGEPNEGSELSG
jgi:hypothetical protein